MAGDTRIKKRILLLYPYYWPLYKAGGPVQSLFNLAAALKKYADFYFVSLDKDIDGEKAESDLLLNKWNTGPNRENIFVSQSITFSVLRKVISEADPDIIMINGIFHWNTSLLGLFISKSKRKKVVISPRGMLQPWALRRGELKKKLFLQVFRRRIKNDEVWHATDERERDDIHRIFGKDQRVFVASNVARPMSEPSVIPFPAADGKVNLVFLSLINPNKNLHLIIEAVNQLNGKFTLDIYGPVIDQEYWQKCRRSINDSSVIRYNGPVPPWKVGSVISQYHFFVLPTQGENFGHAVFDACSCSVPVIISRFTPWTNIDNSSAGMYIDIKDSDSLKAQLETIATMSANEYTVYRKGAYQFAKNYLDSKDYVADYGFLLNDIS